MEAADIVKRALRAPGECVLATVIAVEGHAYRKFGAMMLLREKGDRHGFLSPGCLESDLAAYVPAVLQGGKPQLVEYDMTSSEDFSWGEAIGCGGKISVLLEPAAGTLLNALRDADRYLDQGFSVKLIRVLNDGFLPTRYSALPLTVDENTAQDLGYPERQCEPGNLQMIWHPKPRLVLFGAGDDAIPVCALAMAVGFRVTVIDFREAVCRPERFPGAEVICGFPSELGQKLVFGIHDFVVIMSHQFLRDREFLELAIAGNPRYIGMMGSSSRTERMLDGKAAPSVLRYPVGLPIGGDGPQEIAVSIAAELVSVRRGRDGIASRDSWALSRGRKQHPYGAKQA